MSSTVPKRILVGIGNAGVTVLDRIAVEHPGLRDILVINNDAESLAASVVAGKIALPDSTEGDLTAGFMAIEEEFAGVIRGAASVILCGGLGGETGSFLIPALAARAKADGITTLASVGIPFSFEGRQRRELAAHALQKLQDICDGVAAIDNDRLSGGLPSSVAIGDAFAAADRALTSSMIALQGMLSTAGPVKISRSDLASVLGSHGALTHFAHGHASGANRLHEALEDALKGPLLSIPGKGSALKEATTLLLLLSGPSDLSFAEVQRAVAEIERISGERCQIKIGVHALEPQGAPLDLFLMASSGNRKPPLTRNAEQPVARPAESRQEAADPIPENPVTVPSPESKVTRPVKKSVPQQTQGVLDLETYQRGRFDKSEPTIVNGDDLDIPTFLRKGVKLSASAKR